MSHWIIGYRGDKPKRLPPMACDVRDEAPSRDLRLIWPWLAMVAWRVSITDMPIPPFSTPLSHHVHAVFGIEGPNIAVTMICPIASMVREDDAKRHT